MQIGLADFAEPTLLILGTKESLIAFANIMEKRQPINLATSEFITLVNIGLAITPTSNSGSLGKSGERFTWQISTEEVGHFAEQIRALADHPGGAHIYLDPHVNAAAVQILISKGEYGAGTVFAAN